MTHTKKAKGTRKTTARRRRPAPEEAFEDINMRVAGALFDMAALQPNERAQFGYKRAARVVVALPMEVSDLVRAGSLRDVQYIGPSSARVIAEIVEGGASPTVEAAVAASGKAPAVAAQRELRANFLSHFAMERAMRLPLGRDVVSRGAFRGDFQMHTTGSDGTESVRGMLEACAALGHTCLGVTDHSYGLPVARGMSMSAVARQHAEIDRLNAEFAGRFRVFKGIEANILADGNLDLQPEECVLFDFVVASPHSLLRKPEDQTRRMLGALRHPGVAILGHPRGRMYNNRAGVAADWPRVFAEAAERRIAIELDGNWHRQDIDWALARVALAAGCLFALDSDAHSVGELRFTDYAIAHARLAGVPADRVINCWSDAELDAWMAERRGG